MSLEISSSNFRMQDSLFSIELATNSNQFTPIMELEGASASSSDLQPKVLHFADRLLPPEPNIQINSIELLYGSRLYESFEFQHEPELAFEPKDQLEVKDFEDHYLHTVELFPSVRKAVSEEPVASLCSQQMPTSRRRSRKDSLSYFSDQLTELKKNVNKLISIINRNPEEEKLTPPSCQLPHPSINLELNHKESLDAKSTQSQNLKDTSRRNDIPIGSFESPAKREECGLQNVSPIQPREQISVVSNVSEFSTRSLMRRKMKSSVEVGANSV